MTAVSRIIFLSLCSVITLAVAATNLPAQDAARLAAAKRAAERIRSDDILRDVSYLASDANMGRRTPSPGYGSPGYDSAAAYIARFLKASGVKPMGDSGTYFQHYTVTRATLDTTAASGAIGNERLVWGDDFIVGNFLVPGIREAEVLYVGNRHPPASSSGVDPYAGLDIGGKWSLLVNAPAGGGGRGTGGPGANTGVVGVDYLTINEIARHGNALGILLVPSSGQLATLESPRNDGAGSQSIGRCRPRSISGAAVFTCPVQALRRPLAGTQAFGRRRAPRRLAQELPAVGEYRQAAANQLCRDNGRRAALQCGRVPRGIGSGAPGRMDSSLKRRTSTARAPVAASQPGERTRGPVQRRG